MKILTTWLFLIFVCLIFALLVEAKKGSRGRGGGLSSRGSAKSRSSSTKTGGSWFSFTKKQVPGRSGSVPSSSRWRQFAAGAGVGYVAGRSRVPYYFIPISWGLHYNTKMAWERDMNVCQAEIKFEAFENYTEAMTLNGQNSTRVFFLCKGRCCELDCCEINTSFTVVIALILLVLLLCSCCYCCFLIEKTEEYWAPYLSQCHKKPAGTKKVKESSISASSGPKLAENYQILYSKEEIQIRKMQLETFLKPDNDKSESNSIEGSTLSGSAIDYPIDYSPVPLSTTSTATGHAMP